jgi:hypothetical protein
VLNINKREKIPVKAVRIRFVAAARMKGNGEFIVFVLEYKMIPETASGI